MNPLDELKKLTSTYPELRGLVNQAEHVPSAMTPEPYRLMLVHDQHMTVTMESYHQSPIDLRILDKQLEGDIYSRRIQLLKSGTEDVVQFGIVRFNLNYVTAVVRDEILSGEIPLGRILIDHNVLRHIDLGAILRITTDPALAKHLQTQPNQVTFGRLATIFCNNAPAVDLLEIPAPLPEDSTKL